MLNRSNAEAIVCVVDDDSDIRDGLKLLMESVGIGCFTFSSTREFLESEQITNANCLILDVRLPGAGGLDLQAELTRAQVRTPIIFITAHGDIPMSVRAIKAGAVEFLTKPFREQDLLDAVRTALERDRLQRIQEHDLQELQARFETLTERERKVMTFVIAGLLNKQTASQMGVSEVTVKVHRHRLMNKLGAKSLPDLVRMAENLRIEPFAMNKVGDQTLDAGVSPQANAGKHKPEQG
jgi:FixJ family two-component response regulator